MGSVYLQLSGRPIGLRKTASLASVVMKEWDVAFMELMDREGITIDLFMRYVDDYRFFLRPLNERWYWAGDRFEFSWERREEDLKSQLSDQSRTTIELIKVMNSLVQFLRFTSEHYTMFESRRLPTLDSEIWFEEGKFYHSFYEKPQNGNRVLQKDTALPVNTLRASLMQEVVRRATNCSLDLPKYELKKVLDEFSQKLVNSGHSNASARVTIVQGITKFLDNVRLSKLPEDHKHFRPLHLSKEYKREDRQIEKIMNKLTYEGNSKNSGREWKSQLTGKWRGERPSQLKVKDMKCTTIMMVPDTVNGVLFMSLCRSEPKLAKTTGYQVKMCESSGTQLSKLFKVPDSRRKCHRENCVVCKSLKGKGKSKFNQMNVVYEAKCELCMNQFEEERRNWNIHR